MSKDEPHNCSRVDTREQYRQNPDCTVRTYYCVHCDKTLRIETIYKDRMYVDMDYVFCQPTQRSHT